MARWSSPGLPTDVLDAEVIRAIFAGGADAVAAAGAFIGKSHTVKDAEVKYGLAVTGRVGRPASPPTTRSAPGKCWCIRPLGCRRPVRRAHATPSRRPVRGLDDQHDHLERGHRRGRAL
ncbi:MAG: hypothetical protein R3F60_24305 [bacterium]